MRPLASPVRSVRLASLAAASGALVSLASLTACSSSSDHNPAAPPCEPHCPVTGPTGGGGGGGDAGTDATGDAIVSETGLVAVTVTGNTTVPFGLPSDPSTAVVDTLGYTVSSTKIDGTPTSVVTTGGTFQLPDVAVGTDTTWFAVQQGTTVRSIIGLPLPQTSAAFNGFSFPVYSTDTLNGACASVALAYDNTKATVVIQVIQQTSAGVRSAVTGATAGANTSGAGPFYDEGTEAITAGTKTGNRGTIAFLNVIPDTSLARFAANVVSNGTYNIRANTVAGAVTYLLLVVAAP